MANVEIIELTALTNPASSDVLPIVDVGADETKKVTIANLLENAGSGTASAPGIAFDGDSNTGIYRPGADQLALATNGTNRLFIDSSGNAGIGTTNPSSSHLLHVNGKIKSTGFGTGATIQSGFDLDIAGLSILRGTTYTYAINGISGDTAIVAPGGQSLIFKDGSAENARIDSSGRLLVGTSSDSGGALLQVNGDRVRIATAKTPASASDTGTTGEVSWDANYIYVCTATNTWKRAALSTW